MLKFKWIPKRLSRNRPKMKKSEKSELIKLADKVIFIFLIINQI